MKVDMQIVNTILEQLGGRRFDVMTGARDFSYDQQAKALIFHLPRRTGNDVTAVQIQLLGNDTYKMIFWDFRLGRNFHLYEVAKIEGIYADQLQTVFAEYTGLATSFETMER